MSAPGQTGPARARVVVGIFAHNEQPTIRRAVDAFLAQRLRSVELAQIVVVCCGCTDLTVPTVRRLAARDPRLRVLVRAQREGKVAAINEFLQVVEADLLVLASGDVVPADDLVELLVGPLLADRRSMMTGPRVLAAPTADRRRLVDNLHEGLWALHHEVALRRPKLGEIVALRRDAIGRTLPTGVHCDEALMESVVVARGGRLRYVADARAYNLAPPGIAALYRQRRRIAAQHRILRRQRGYVPATADPLLVAEALRTVPPALFSALLVLAALEVAARLHGAWDQFRGRSYQTWRPARARSSGGGGRPPGTAAHSAEPSAPPPTRVVSPL